MSFDRSCLPVLKNPDVQPQKMEPFSQTVRSDLEKNRGFSTTFCSVNARPGRAITLLRGNGRALTKCDLTDNLHLKLLHLSVGLELLNRSEGRREVALHSFVKQIPPLDIS